LLIAAIMPGSWLCMQAIHEAGHVLAAGLTGGQVERVVLHPLAISRTDSGQNPRPLAVAWAGPLVGTLFPVVFWFALSCVGASWAFVARFFAGFCLIANGGYLAVGSIDGVGDAGEIVRHGAPIWSLWLFGALAIPAGLLLWHRLGAHFGLGTHGVAVPARLALACLGVLVALIVLGLVVGDG
jgi:hypothetical protein